MSIVKRLLISLLLMSSLPIYGQECVGTIIQQFIDNGDGTVTHKKNGLMWKKCIEGYRWDKEKNTCERSNLVTFEYTWGAALKYIKDLNETVGFANSFDWRMPNIKELATIGETQCFSPAINLTVFPNPIPATWSFEWSSTPLINESRYALVVGYSYGLDVSTTAKNEPLSLRLVRGGS